METQRSALITGCSQGGLGEALAFAFNDRGLKVFASARDPSKMADLKTKGIELVQMDVLSPVSITQAVTRISSVTNGSLDILVNNAGACYSMPLVDASLHAARDLFDLNVISILAITQAFLPLLRKSTMKAMIVNQTSISSISTVPMTGVYNASKAAAAALTENLRLELEPFHICVVDLKTGAVRSSFYSNQNRGARPQLPQNSIYSCAKTEVEYSMTGEALKKDMVPADRWAASVVSELLVREPPVRIWKGGNASLMWFTRRFLPFTFLDGTMKKLGALDVVERKMRKE